MAGQGNEAQRIVSFLSTRVQQLLQFTTVLMLQQTAHELYSKMLMYNTVYMSSAFTCELSLEATIISQVLL